MLNLRIQFLALLILFTGCASNVKVKTPGSFFITSESTGEFGNATLIFHQLSGTDSNFNFNNDSLTEKLDLSANADVFGITTQLGLLTTVDFIYKAATHTPEMYGVKVQLDGAHQSNAQKGDSSLSLIFMGGASRYETSDGSNIGIQSNSQSINEITFRRTHTIIHFGLLYGIRLEDYWLIYGHLSESKNTVHGEIDFEDNILDQQQAKYTASILNSTVGMAFDNDQKNLSLYLEMTMQDVKWSYTPRERLFLMALGIGYQF